MTSYVKSVLQPGEVVRHSADLHWILYAPGALCTLAAFVIFLLLPAQPGFVHWLFVVVSAILLAVGVGLMAQNWYRWWTTEIAVTDRRIIYKTGFIYRETSEMHMDKVESVDVDQSILGRLLDYGDVSVVGTGSTWETLRTIARPIELRNHITAR
jgi:uncharacterized membrane protein YdbT with pleckstrin-like domain